MSNITLSSETLSILKNFVSINPSIYFTEGNVIKTLSPSKTIMAKANISETFDSNFAIYDLNRFLSVLSLFDNPKIEIKDKVAVIKQDKRKVNYTFTDPSMIVYPEKDPKTGNCLHSFSLNEEQLKLSIKGLNVLSMPELRFVGKNSKVFIEAIDTKNPTSDFYSMEVGETEEDFSVIIKKENFLIIPANYIVEVFGRSIKLTNDVLTYFIAAEQ